MDDATEAIAVWCVTFLGALTFVFSLKTQRVTMYMIYTVLFAACTATVALFITT